MLEGMAPALAEAAAARFGGLLLYAPIVGRGDIESAIAYLVRRLDENSGPDNFLTHSFALQVGFAGLGGRGGPFPAGRGSPPPSRHAHPAGAGPGRTSTAAAAASALISPTSPTPTSRSPPTAIGSPGTWTTVRAGRPAGVPAGGRRAQAVDGASGRVGRSTRAPAGRWPTAGPSADLALVEEAVAAARPRRSRVGGDTSGRPAAACWREPPRPWPAGGASSWRSWPSTRPRQSARAIRRCRRPSTSPPITPRTSRPRGRASGPTAPWWWPRRGTSPCRSRPAACWARWPPATP